MKLEYKKETLEHFGEILNSSNIEKYSPKIKLLTNYIKNSEGIILIYSKYIYSGILPIALALEHLGYNKYNNNNLLVKPNKSKGSKSSTSEFRLVLTKSFNPNRLEEPPVR